MALSSLQLVEELRRLDRELTHCEWQKALRDLLKIILLGFFLYRDVDLRISDIHKRMRTLCEPIEKDIFEAEHEFKQLLDSERYFSISEYEAWKYKWNGPGLLVADCIANHRILSWLHCGESLANLTNYFTKGIQVVKQRNKQFVAQEIQRFQEFFDHIEAYPLTQSQRESIVIDEQNNLVVAGAGTGKTTTMVGKAGYLIKKGLAKPEEILMISFARAVADEMKDRIHSRLGLQLNIATFHSLGLRIIAESDGVKSSVSELASDNLKLAKTIEGFVGNRVRDPSFLETINQFGLFHYVPYKSAFEFDSLGAYYEYIKNYSVRSLKGHWVKSLEECDIANFLYLNGINYEYEKRYEIETATREHSQYGPDFYLPDYGIYIEHFGITRDNHTAPYVPTAQYLQDMEWKRNTNLENNTTLIETYHYDSTEGKLLDRLKEKL